MDPFATIPTDSNVRAQWSLRPGVTYLNHGSFGPAPHPVQRAREQWFQRLESEPVDFFLRQLEPNLADARLRLADFVGCRADDLVMADNSTFAMNIVATSVRLAPGDEVLVTDHEYGAVTRLWQRKCDAAGARVVTVSLPSPIRAKSEVVEAIVAAIGPRARLLVFSHVTSPTAIILPARKICQAVRQLDIAICIDGPHAVGMLPLDIAALDCDYYTASCHKWLCAPFGSGFLYVHPRAQASIQPAVVSWGRPPTCAEPSWRDEFGWLGTRDPAAFLSVPAAIDFLAGIGWDRFRQQTHALAQLACERITAITGLAPLVPDSSEWYGSMISLPLPPGESPPLQQALWERYQIEVPIVAWQDRRLVRPCCHLYNEPADIERLAVALEELLGTKTGVN